MSIASKALLVDTTFKKVGKSKQDKQEAMNIAAAHKSNPEMWKVTKNLWPEQAGSPLHKIRRLEVTTREWHRTHTLPWSDKGYRILRSSMFTRYREYMQGVKSDHKAHVKAFGDGYPDLLKECQDQLGSKFNPDEYPSAANIMGKFSFSWDYHSVPRIDDFRVELLDEDMESLRQQLEESEARGIQNMQDDIIHRIAEPLHHIFTLLDEGKSFKVNSFNNLINALELVMDLDVTGSAELAQACFDIRSQVCFNPELIRENEEVANASREAAKKHLDNLDAIFG